MTDNELLLLKISEMLDQKLEEKFAINNALLEAKIEAKFDAKIAGLESRLLHIEDDLRDVRLKLEHVVMPQIQLLAENYVPAAKRFQRLF